MTPTDLWRRYNQHLCTCRSVGIQVDVSRIEFDADWYESIRPAMQRAFDDMAALEDGAIANPDEERMVGHYWLRAPQLAPDDVMRAQIETARDDVVQFADRVHLKEITPPAGSGAPRFTDLLLVGIGGSALGPQLVADALGTKRDQLRVYFFDNTDPDGMARTVDHIGARLKSTMVVVVSKSGTTPETRNGMLEITDVFTRKGLSFACRAVAVTREDSKLDQIAQRDEWLARFPMWDWVGGRTSVFSAVGLLPAAIQGIDVQAMLDGAARMDEATRRPDAQNNPAALLAMMWHHETNGRGEKDMVILPYKDRLLLMSRYLQQLIMESLGKGKDLNGNTVCQGITVYGNKGSTDQHAYVQQLRDGVNNFFATFIVVKRDHTRGRPHGVEVEPGVTSGDFLNGLWQGTRQALYENGRGSITITLDKLDARSVGALIALYERAVGLYASLVNVNAYHQPGVEAGKKAAAAVLDVQHKATDALRAAKQPMSPDEIAVAIEQPEHVETVHHVLEHMTANDRGIKRARGKFVWKS